MSSKLELPNPGNKRYWIIDQDAQGDFVLTLYGQFGRTFVSDYVGKDEVSGEKLIQLAHTLIARIGNQNDYNGTYTYEENI